MSEEKKKSEGDRVQNISILLVQAMEEGPDPVMITEFTGKILYVNKRFLEITGYAEQEILGENPSILSAGKTPDEIYKQLWKTICSGQVWRGELYNRKKDGEPFWEFISIAPIKDPSGFISHFVSTWKDITEKKQTEAKLEKIAAELDRSNKELEQFAYVASHDLQAPLGRVGMYIELLETHYKNKLDKPAQEFIRFAKDGVEHSRILIRNLLDYAKVGTEKRALEMTDFETLLKRVLSVLEVSILESSAEITHDPLPKLMTDSFQMLRLFQNILSNALKYRGSEPLKIHISAKREDKEWIFSVQDNGMGIAPKDNERVFVLFQRLRTEDKYPGTGIGLAVCKKIVENHGGKIWLKSEVGKGTTFYFSIPD